MDLDVWIIWIFSNLLMNHGKQTKWTPFRLLPAAHGAFSLSQSSTVRWIHCNRADDDHVHLTGSQCWQHWQSDQWDSGALIFGWKFGTPWKHIKNDFHKKERKTFNRVSNCFVFSRPSGLRPSQSVGQILPRQLAYTHSLDTLRIIAIMITCDNHATKYCNFTCNVFLQATVFLQRDLLWIQDTEKSCPEPHSAFTSFNSNPSSLASNHHMSLYSCNPWWLTELWESRLGCGTSNIFPDRSTVARTFEALGSIGESRHLNSENCWPKACSPGPQNTTVLTSACGLSGFTLTHLALWNSGSFTTFQNSN